jgi:hypothetical protein
MTLLFVFPLLLEVSILVAASLLFTFVGFIIVRKKFSHESLSENHTVASYIFNAFSISYGVLLAFVVYANWFDNERAQQNVAYETSYISNFYRDTRTLPDSARDVITNRLINYTKLVVEDEWPKMAEGNTSRAAEAELDSLWNAYIKIPANRITNTYLYQIALERLNFISQYRRLRILDMEQTTPAIIWIVLLICFFVSLGYTYFFTTKKKRLHLSLIATFIIINVLIFYLIYVLDHPFKGYSGISSEPFKLLLDKFISGG